MINIALSGSKTLRRLLSRQYRELDTKLAALAKYAPGTSHHTKAQREADTARYWIAQIESELQRRG